ncbi:uncharacterized protein LOC132281068 [Cornus florida]|uniref:uncharacterized protein LOC132281068 n=1 Tax=Cornus florida TaxID=4283 RepID=UPI00289CF7D0|nr:uncharacterized protein LOC132281068 [Cornus florida]
MGPTLLQMGNDKVHDLLINFDGHIHVLNGINPNGYSFLDLYSSTYAFMLRNVNQTGMTVNIFYKFPGNCGRLLLNGDDDMIIMFEMNLDVREMDIIVEFVDKGVPIDLDSQCPLQNSEGEDEDSEGEDEDSDDSQKSNYSFSNSDDDEDWNEGNEGNEAHDWDNIELESESSDNSCGDLSDYNDSAEFSGESGDERKGSVHQHIKGIVFKYGANGEIKFVKDHLFDDINHFRTVLKEYSVQKGFKLVMKKNEKRVNYNDTP